MKICIWWSYSGALLPPCPQHDFNEESHTDWIKFSLTLLYLAETNTNSSQPDGKKEPNCPKNPILIYKFIKSQAGIIFNLSKDSVINLK